MQGEVIIAVVAKAPFPGREGPRESHDWHRAAALAAEIHRATPGSRVAVVSGFEFGGVAEADVYVAALAEMGVAEPIVLREGWETIRQIEAAERLADERNASLTFVSTALHRPRVWYYARSGATHRSAWGTPHPHEPIKDLLAIPSAVLIDLLGLRGWYLRAVEARRKRGVLVLE